MLSYSEWGANAVVVRENTDECYVEVPLIQTGVTCTGGRKSQCVERVTVCVRGIEGKGYKIVLTSSPKVADRFRANLEAPLDVAAKIELNMTIPAREIKVDDENAMRPLMIVSSELQGNYEKTFEGPFDPFETTIFIVGRFSTARVTCYTAEQVGMSTNRDNAVQLLSIEQPMAAEKVTRKGPGRKKKY